MNNEFTNYLDCSHEASAQPVGIDKNRQWLANDLSTEDWLYSIDDAALSEIHTIASTLADDPDTDLSQLDKLHLQSYALPHCTRLFAKIKESIDHGRGFAVADRLPVDDYPAEVLARVFYILGQVIGQPVSQKHSGKMIYDVRDSGSTFGYGVRGSVTNVELNFHTDNAFGQATPEYVGLFCRHPAKQGGVSRFCSLYALHNHIESVSPKALQRLYQPMFFDRQKEHAEGDPPVTLAPYFSWRTTPKGNQKLHARANTSLVRKGYEVAGVQMEKELVHALDVVDETSAQNQFWYEANLEKGQIQYLNNRETGHYRSEFVDYEEPDKKRHLYRLWHRNEGHSSYHGLD